jgi:Ca2+-binding RTX toxin-like protein
MSAFRFETMSASDAAGYGAGDSLAFDGANAAAVTVLYAAAGDHVTISYGARSMDFSTAIEGQAGAPFADGSQLFVGGVGADTATGGAGNDALYGGAGADSLNGGDGADMLQGNQGEDNLAGGLGNDVIYGGQDNDTIHVGAVAGPGQAPLVSPASETNFANGNKGDDIVVGAAGADTLLGGQGNDVLAGGDGNDFLNGNLGDDIITGDNGNDTIAGEGGQDFLSGGDGADTFVFAAGSSDAPNQLVDTIMDWSAADHIRLEGVAIKFAPVAPPVIPGYSYGGYDYPGMVDTSYGGAMGQANNAMHADPALSVVASQVGTDVVLFVDVNGDHTADLAITLSGASLADVSAANFV